LFSGNPPNHFTYNAATGALINQFPLDFSQVNRFTTFNAAVDSQGGVYIVGIEVNLGYVYCAVIDAVLDCTPVLCYLIFNIFS
jgi:hypothetical protein